VNVPDPILVSPLAPVTITTLFPPELDVSLPSNKSAFKFATFVVEATSNGAVPVDTVDLTTPVKVETPDTFKLR